MRKSTACAIITVPLLWYAYDAQPAQACQCLTARELVPADGSVDVPTNTAILSTFGSPLILRAEGGEEVALTREWLTNLSAVAVERHTPDTELQPNTDYTVVVDDYDQQMFAFRTGAASDHVGPVLSSVAIDGWVAEGSSECGDCLHGELYSEMDVAFESDEAPAYFVMAFETGGEVVRSYGLLPSHLSLLRSLDTATCGLAPPLDGGEWCIELTGYDIAGNGTPTRTCFTPQVCAPVDCDGLPTCAPQESPGCATSAKHPAWPLFLAVVLALGVRCRRRASSDAR